MASGSQYNALVKSMPGGEVTWKLLLTDLNLVPRKWTILFRGQYLSRNVNIEKLLCSPEDPIIIYKEKVKPPSFPFIVQVDCSGVTQFEENGNISLEVKALDSVGNLRGRIATELGKPDEDIKLMYNDRVLKDYESLQDCKIVKDGCKISAKIEEDPTKEKMKEVQPTRISKTYRVCLGGNKAEDKEKMAFIIVREDKPKFKFEKCKGGKKRKRVEIKRREVVIEAMNCDTVDILKRRICAVFEVDAENRHSICMNDRKLESSATLGSRNFLEGQAIYINSDYEYKSDSTDDEEELKQQREKEQEKRKLEKEKRKETKRKVEERRACLRRRPWHHRGASGHYSGITSYNIAEANKLEQKLQEKKEREEREMQEWNKRKERERQEWNKRKERERQEKLEKRIQFKKEMETWSDEKKLEWKIRRDKRKECRRWQFYVCGGGPIPASMPFFPAQDVDRKAISMEGETPTHQWNLYSFGMTLYGTCSNAQCISGKTKVKNENGVSHIAGYGNIILTPERNKFPCSACKEMFPVKEFVLCGGRALFRFKKSGIGQPVKTVVIESVYDLMKYATFDKAEKGKGVKMSNYDFIEITTVKLWCGLYTCVGCDEMIRFKQDENVLRCGHAYHNECTPVNVGTGGGDEEDDDSTAGCYACNAEQVGSVYDMLGMAGESSSSEAALVRPL